MAKGFILTPPGALDFPALDQILDIYTAYFEEAIVAGMQTLQDLIHAFRLYAVCEPCRRVAAVGLQALIEREGSDYPIERIRMRLKCGTCGQRSQSIRIVYVGPEGRASEFRYARQTQPLQHQPRGEH